MHNPTDHKRGQFAVIAAVTGNTIIAIIKFL
jgi:hypothetical protein